MTRPSHIVFAGGGTAGHLFPGLAVAARLRLLAPKLRITFIGTGRSFESERVIAAGHEYLALPCRPLPRRARETFRFLTDNLAGFYAARRFLREQSVSLVVGLGGYASAPAARAAISRRIPFILLSKTRCSGRATRWLARRAAPGVRRICRSAAAAACRRAAGNHRQSPAREVRSAQPSNDSSRQRCTAVETSGH